MFNILKSRYITLRSFKAAIALTITFLVTGISATYSRPPEFLSDSTVKTPQIYAKYCAECHGADGRAQTKKGRDLFATDFTTGGWNADTARGIRIISNGKEDMPGFKRKLKPSEIKSVFAYVLKFRK
jgi:mono/diheme cytochrome c family protein